MKLFTHDQVNIAGHKVPIAFLGVIATIVAAVLLIRYQGANSKNAAAAAQQQAASTGLGIYGGASGSDYTGSLQNLQTQLQSLLQGFSQLPTQPAPAPVVNPPPTTGVGAVATVSTGPGVPAGVFGLGNTLPGGIRTGLSNPPASAPPRAPVPTPPWVVPLKVGSPLLSAPAGRGIPLPGSGRSSGTQVFW